MKVQAHALQKPVRPIPPSAVSDSGSPLGWVQTNPICSGRYLARRFFRLATKLVAKTAIVTSISSTGVAHAVSGKSSESFRTSRSYSAGAPRTSLLKVVPIAPRATPPRKLILDQPVEIKNAESSSLKTIKSLATGDSLINPWVPGRGALGVKVQVTW
jgi:hypothetical protein